MASTTSRTYKFGSSSHLGLEEIRIFLNLKPTCLNLDNHHQASLAFSVTPSQLRTVLEY